VLVVDDPLHDTLTAAEVAFLCNKLRWSTMRGRNSDTTLDLSQTGTLVTNNDFALTIGRRTNVAVYLI
jgi:hypothetical protein